MATRQPGKRPKAPVKKAPPKAPVKVVRPPPRKLSSITAVNPADVFATLDALRIEAANAETPQSKREWTGWLRRMAGQLVVADDLERTITQWHRDHFSDLIAIDTFQRWATEDGWLKQREERLTKFREAVERQIGTDNVRAFVEDLRKLDALHEDLASKISGEGNTVKVPYVDDKGVLRMREVDVVPIAFEKRSEAVGALVALDRRRDEKRKGVLGGLPAALGTGGGNRETVAASAVSLTPNVARAMARAKLIAEREELAGFTGEGAADGADDGGEE